MSNRSETMQPYFRISREFPAHEGVGQTDFDAQPYLLNAREIDLPDLFHQTQERFRTSFAENVAAAMESPAWGNHHLSLRDADPNLESIDPLLGGVRIPTDLRTIGEPNLARFYNPGNRRFLSRVDLHRGTLRGAEYFVGMDPTLPVPVKLEHMKQLFEDTVFIADSLPPHMDREEFLLRLGVLDMHSNLMATAYHTLTYRERSGSDFSNDEEYMRHRQTLERLTIKSYRRFLQGILGQPFDEPEGTCESFDDLRDGSAAFDYLKQRNVDRRHIPVPELSNPITMLLTADAATRRYGKPADLVIGVPSGGTYLGIATQLLHEYRYGVKPELLLCPNSNHSDKYLDGAITPQAVIEQRIGERGGGFTAMVCDDNANTFTTMSRMDETLRARGAADVVPVIGELDVHRAMIKQGTWAPDARPRTIANFVRLAETAGGIAPVTRHRPNDRQLRRLMIMNTFFYAYQDGHHLDDDFVSAEMAVSDEGVTHIDATVPYAEYMSWLYEQGGTRERLTAGKSEELMAKRLPIRFHELPQKKAEIGQRQGPVEITVTPDTIQNVDYLLYLMLPADFNHPVTIHVRGGCDERTIQAMEQRIAHYQFPAPISFRLEQAEVTQ